MKKIHIIIFTVTLLLISFLCIKYIENIPHENERISYAKTNMLGHGGGCPPFYILQIEKNGTISIDGRNFKPFELKPIFKSAFDRFGCGFPIFLHVDKDSKMSTIKPVIDELLLASWHRILLVARGKNSGLYRFRVIIGKDESKSKNINIIKLSGKNILLNNRSTALNKIDEDDRNAFFYYNTKIICSENVLYQDLINILSICCCGNEIYFEIEEKNDKKTPPDLTKIADK